MVRRRRPRQHPCGSLSVARARLRAWYTSALGQRLLESEQAQLDDVLCNLFGYHLVQVGSPADKELLCASRIAHSVIIDREPQELSEPLRVKALCGGAEALPIASDSVDVVLYHHTLEFTQDPHQVLREADRVLVAEGYVVIVGFNPWSGWLPWHWMFRWMRQPPWCGWFLSMARIKDWLALLGFDVVQTGRYFFRPPLGSHDMMDRLSFMERWGARLWPVLGAGYLIVARKRVTTLTPLKPRWRPRRSLVPSGVIESHNCESASDAER